MTLANIQSGSHVPAGSLGLNLHDFSPDMRTFYAEVIAGLQSESKSLPCKYLYDDRGSKLFDDICNLVEYYPTRIELTIMRDWVSEIAELLGERCRLVEYGSGNSLKTRILLERLKDMAAYVPVDISRSHLLASAQRLAVDYPNVLLQPVCADYTVSFTLPTTPTHVDTTVVYFPGSTIGNFHPLEAREFLKRIAGQCGFGGGLLIGVDLMKDPAVLHAAYNDSRGVTADFNRNILTRINRELGGDFLTNRFDHSAFYNVFQGRVEMHLVSLQAQTVRVGGEIFHFDEGETIHTECSYKYSVEEFADLAQSAGFTVVSIWTDPENLFSVQYLKVA